MLNKIFFIALCVAEANAFITLTSMEASKIIVIHPGSQNLRIGRASDLNPETILHAVAYKRYQSDQSWPYHDPLLPAIDNINPMRLQVDFEEQRLCVSRILQSCIVNQCHRLRVATPPQQLANYNRMSSPEKIQSPDAQKHLPWIDYNADVLFDKQLLRLNAFDIREYDIHFPMRRGELHLHKDKGGSMTAVLSHLDRIWSFALTKRLGIPRKELSEYSAVLVISDIYKRSHLRELTSLLFQRLGFKACFLHQDHVSATFGAGLGYACVVDIGDQKCSISCVEDGISQTESRVRLPYGGGDVAQVLLMLLRKCAFPYRECNVQDSYVDAKVITQLKERFCHLQANICGAHEKTFIVRKHNGQWLRFTLQVGDECIMAPMALFNTELLNITGRLRTVSTQIPTREQVDCEDCFDAEYLRETSRRNGGRDQFFEGNTLIPITGDTAEDELIVVDADDTNGQQTQMKDREYSAAFFNSNGQIVSLDVAVIRSIDRCTSSEIKHKMFGCILLVGGGSKTPGLASWLECKISEQISNTDVNVFTKDMDASIVAWKGAAIMSVLDSGRELLITRPEWIQHGLRVLREKAPFIW